MRVGFGCGTARRLERLERLVGREILDLRLPADLDLADAPAAGFLHVLAHVDVDLLVPAGRHPVEHDVLALESRDSDALTAAKAELDQIPGYGDHLHPRR